MKRILSVILVLSLVLTALPMISVSAAVSLNPNGITEIQAKDNNASWDASTEQSVRIEGGNLSFDSKDWAEFEVVSPKAGLYNLTFFTRRPLGSTFFRVYVDGVEQAYFETTTGIDWNTSVESETQVTLKKGGNLIRVENAAGVALYFRSFTLDSADKPVPSRTSGPYKELFLPTIIEAEDYDLGTQGSYSVDGKNNGKQYRKDEPLNIYANGAGGYYVDLAATESATYTFNVKHADAYTLLVAPNATGEANIYIDDAVSPVKVYTSSAKEAKYDSVYFPEGEHKIKVLAGKSGFKFDYLRFSQGGENVKTIEDYMIEADNNEGNALRIEGEHPVYKSIYVSENGNDNGIGTQNAPFLTLERALEEVASINDDMNGDIVINIMSGEYFISETLQITTEHSGKNGYDVIFKGIDKNNPPILHGGQKITGWTEYKDGIYKAPVEGDIEYIRNLYVDGQPMVRSRSKYTYAVGSVDESNDTVKVEGDNFPLISKVDELETVWQLTWFMERFKVNKLERNGNDVLLHVQEGAVDQSAATSGTLGITYGKAFFLENAMELLDEPGEFYYNKDEKVIYFYPYKEHNISTMEAYVPVTEYLVNVNGNNLRERVTNIKFDNLDFRYGAWNDPSTEGFVGSQATHIYRYNNGIRTSHTMPGQITVNRAENIFVNNCRFSCMTSVALLMEDAVKNAEIDGNAFWNIGGTGVVIDTFDHDPHFADDDSKLALMEQCENILVSNNIFRRVALEYFGCTSIHAYYPKNIKIYHNDMADMPYTGFSVGWGWGSEELTDWNFDVSYNRVVDVMKIMNDGAHLYTLGETTGSIISNNYFKTSGDARGGIYNDSGSANIDIFSNVFEDVGLWWFQGSYHTNNLKAYDNYSERIDIRERTGRGNTLQKELLENGHTLVPNANWTGKAAEIVANAGLEDGYEHLYDLMQFPEWMANPGLNLPDKEVEWKQLNWIQAEDYMLGGEGVGYHKITPVYSTIRRYNEGVSLEGDMTSQAMGYYVGTDFHGEWWAYEVDVPENGDYSVVLRAAQQNWGAGVDIYVDGEKYLEGVSLKDDTTYNRFNNTHVGNVNLTKGKHIIKIVINGGSFFFDAWALIPVDVPINAPANSSDEGVIVSYEEFVKNRIEKHESEEIIFDDMINHWAKSDVSLLAGAGIINGVGNNLYAPDSTLTKKQATLLVLRALKLIYNDATEANWLNVALENDILENADNLDVGITREEFASILENAIIFKTGESIVDLSMSAFPDYNNVSEKYAISVLSVASHGLMTGDDLGFFNPQKTLTRAEAARTIKRLIYV